MLRLHGASIPDNEPERQCKKITKAPLVDRDREHTFTEDLIVDEAVDSDPKLPKLAKVSSVLGVLQLGGFGPNFCSLPSG